MAVSGPPRGDAVDVDEFSITWALFTRLEEVCEHGQLHDPVVDDLVAGAESTIDLLSGWALVAAYLRARLIEHAETVGCDCGSEDWMRRVQFDNAGAMRDAESSARGRRNVAATGKGD